MLRFIGKVYKKNNKVPVVISRNFITNDYKCTESWDTINSSPIINKINLNDFYNQLDINFSSKGTISAIDVDIFAHAVKEIDNLDELKDLLHKLRLSAETGNMLESTHHATIRNFIKFGYIQELVNLLKDPLNFGVFLDNYTANILLNELLKSENYELAANVASLMMLQEEFTNELTCSLCQYACYKYITNYIPPDVAPVEEPKKKKIEEVKIRVKFLRNPYFDDHFDIKDTVTLAGKTLAWVSEQRTDNLNNNLQIIGWFLFKKYEKLLAFCHDVSNLPTTKVYPEVLNLLEKEKNDECIEKCIKILSKIEKNTDINLEESLKIMIENAINKVQNQDIEMQKKASYIIVSESRQVGKKSFMSQ